MSLSPLANQLALGNPVVYKRNDAQCSLSLLHLYYRAILSVLIQNLARPGAGVESRPRLHELLLIKVMLKWK